MSDGFPIRAQVKLKHGILCDLAERLGGVYLLAERLALPVTTLYKCINFSWVPPRKTLATARWKVAEEILLVLCGKSWDDIFPDELRTAEFAAKPKRFEITREVPLYALAGTDQALLMPMQDEEIHQLELKENIARSVATLKPREQQVLAMRFGLNGEQELTFREIGERLGGIGVERVRQIEAQALRNLRHGSRYANLKPFLEEQAQPSNE